MKPAYNVRFWIWSDTNVSFDWENYAGGRSYTYKASSEQEAREFLAREGWEIKTYTVKDCRHKKQKKK